jgi:hypothetical protein
MNIIWVRRQKPAPTEAPFPSQTKGISKELPAIEEWPERDGIPHSGAMWSHPEEVPPHFLQGESRAEYRKFCSDSIEGSDLKCHDACENVFALTC